MKLESHATPYGGTPQQRYATLHRAIEKGIDSDDVWCELAHVSARLGNEEESRRCLKRIKDSSRRSKTLRLCFPNEARRRKGAAAIPATAVAATAVADTAVAATAGAATIDTATIGGARPVAAVTAQRNVAAEHRPGAVDHLLDSVQYLLHQQMPWLVLSTMLSFPLVVGVGGFLTAGGSMLLLAAIAALPGLSVLAVVTAMGHEILRASSEGEEDVPELPPLGRLVRTARDFLCDGALALLVFFGTPAVLAFAGAPVTVTAPLLLAASYFAPIAFALRQVRRDMRPFSPVFLVRAVRRAGAGYAVVALCSTLAFAPALGVAMATVGRPLWVQIAVVGPLAVLPIFSVARLLGSWLDTQRESLGYLLHGSHEPRRRKVTQEVEKPSGKRRLRRPKSHESMPNERRNQGGGRKQARAKVRTASAIGRKSGRQPSSARSIEGRRPSERRRSRPAHTDQKSGPASPTDLPGAVLVTGAQRGRSGAAARR